MDQFYRFDNFAMRGVDRWMSNVANRPQIFRRADDGWVVLSRNLTITQLLKLGEGIKESY
jgi:hypothetical protein